MAPAAKYVGRLVDWDGGLAVVLFSLGWGFLQGRNFLAARILFTASCVFLAWKAISETRKFEGGPIARFLGSVLVLLMSLLFWIVCWFWVFHNESPEPKPEFLSWLWFYVSWITLLPLRRIFIAALVVGLASAIVAAFVRERRERCPDKRLHALADGDKAAIRDRVRIPGIIYKPYFEARPPYIEIGFSVFNNSLYDIVIDNVVGGAIRFGDDYTEFEYSPPKIRLDKPLYCASRSDAFFDVRQAVTEQEIKLFRETPKIEIRLDTLEVKFRGIEPSPIATTRLDTSNCYLNTKERMWRAWDHLEFVFGWTDDQWALLSSRPPSGDLHALTTPPPVERPNLVFKGIGRVHAYSLYGYPLEEGHASDSNSDSAYQVIALTVQVENEFTDAFKPIPIGDVTAQVFYYPKKSDAFQLHRGSWLGSGNRARFEVNDLRHLVIATVMGEGEQRFVYALNREYRDDQGFDKVGVVLSEDVYDVRVRVISEKEALLHFEKKLVLEVGEAPNFRVSLRPVEDVDQSSE